MTGRGALRAQFLMPAILSAIDVAAVANPDNVDQQHAIKDFVHDPVVADPNSVHRVLALYRHAIRRPRIVGEKIKSRTNAQLFATLKGGQRPHGPARKSDLVRSCHDRPRSALTCSHGM